VTYLAADHPVTATLSVVAAVLVAAAALAVIRFGFNDAYLDDRLVAVTPLDSGLDILRPRPPVEPAGFGAPRGGQHAVRRVGRHRPRTGCRYVYELCGPTPTKGDLEWVAMGGPRRAAAQRARRFRWPRLPEVTWPTLSIGTWASGASVTSFRSLHASSWGWVGE